MMKCKVPFNKTSVLNMLRTLVGLSVIGASLVWLSVVFRVEALQTGDETLDDWLLYEDTSAGYSLRYPPNTQVVVGSSAGHPYDTVDFVMTFRPYEGFTMYVEDVVPLSTVEEIVQQRFVALALGRVPRLGVDVLISPTTDGESPAALGSDAWLVTGLPSGHEWTVIITHRGRAYYFSISPTPSHSMRTIFWAMLRSFEFTNP